MLRESVFEYAELEYGVVPDYPWPKYPSFAVLRHPDSGKWFALVSSVDAARLGSTEQGVKDIINLKCDPVLSASLRRSHGYFPAYHMNKDAWISVLLDGSVPLSDIQGLIDMSYALTRRRLKKPRRATAD